MGFIIRSLSGRRREPSTITPNESSEGQNAREPCRLSNGNGILRACRPSAYPYRSLRIRFDPANRKVTPFVSVIGIESIQSP